ncbi:MFS transporter [Arthrobacter sp. NicSoilC12]|uniref:MFS transporter n=1 Tax=Arthrobacter sp. NicSoilC12 TaxID=2831001 RepID=UPI001CC71DEE|nr:MFS transporter [Arthrobacter sp. NicSoilC12]GIU55596.1 MFS transporter [Arthrobacter sp. NicSoilC12]
MTTAPARTPAQEARALVDGTPEGREQENSAQQRLPLSALVVLAAMGFILVATETMPAGLLPVIAAGLHTGEGTVGLLVSAYALGTVVVTIPAIMLTRGMRRKPLLLGGVAGLVLATTVTAVSPDVTLSLVSRFIAGAFSGIIWGMLAAYGRRISPPRHAGLSLAIVSTGAPLGFAFGTPLGAWIGTAVDWRWSFGALSVLGVIVTALILGCVPDAAGQPRASRLPLGRVFKIPGVAVILAFIVAWMLAHSTIYTYIAPYLRATGTGLSASLVLLVYGIASVVGVAVTGALLDRHPRPLLHLSVTVFVASGLILLFGHASAMAILIAAALWGLTFGGASAQVQGPLTTAGGDNADVANAFLPVAFNLAIFGAGILGALLLTPFDGLVLPVVMIALGITALLLTLYGRRSAFPRRL